MTGTEPEQQGSAASFDRMNNFFASRSASQRYARSRPYFHPLVVGKIRDVLHLSGPVTRALDVACGAGHSSRALTDIAAQVIGVDVASGMLAQTTADPNVAYLQAPSHALPLADHTFDLLTVALAFHWFDRAHFLAEAFRLLRPSAWMVIYNNWFPGQMKENSGFAIWNRQRYLTRYPTPRRNSAPLSSDDAEEHGFRLTHRETYLTTDSASLIRADIDDADSAS